MSLRYRFMYRVGFAPWDTDAVPRGLRELVEGQEPGRALDLGCGTGTQAAYLASRGWQTTAVDAVPRALEAARERARSRGVEVDFRRADVGRLAALGLSPGYGLVFDRGCFHDLPARTRDGYARGVAELAAPGAEFLLLTFAPNGGVGPAGADRDEIERRFGSEWELLSEEPDSGPAPSGPMRDVPRAWFHLRKRAG